MKELHRFTFSWGSDNQDYADKEEYLVLAENQSRARRLLGDLVDAHIGSVAEFTGSAQLPPGPPRWNQEAVVCLAETGLVALAPDTPWAPASSGFVAFGNLQEAAPALEEALLALLLSPERGTRHQPARELTSA